MEINLEDDLVSLKEKLSAAIMSYRQEVEVLRGKIGKNQALLNYIEASLNGHQTSRPVATKASVRSPNKGGRPRRSGTKRDAVLQSIRALRKNVFTGSDVLAELKRRFPEIYMTREHISSLMWRLSKTKYGKETFRQITPWIGGKTPAQYEKCPVGNNGHDSR